MNLQSILSLIFLELSSLHGFALSLAITGWIPVFIYFILIKVARIKANKKIFTTLLILYFLIYLTIGFLLYGDYLIWPSRYDPMYLKWLQSTPIDEFIMDITNWPILGIRNSNSHMPEFLNTILWSL